MCPHLTTIPSPSFHCFHPGGPGVTVPNLPNPGSAGGTFEITIVQSWSQETDYSRVTEVKVPATEAGVKLPVIIDLHGETTLDCLTCSRKWWSG